MFNLLIKAGAWGNGRDTMLTSRVFEHTEDALVQRFRPDRQLDFPSLTSLPTLFAEEGHGEEIARVGTITRARTVGQNIALEYTYDLDIPGVLNRSLQGFADLEIGGSSRCPR
jgi:hypothetical protein